MATMNIQCSTCMQVLSVPAMGGTFRCSLCSALLVAPPAFGAAAAPPPPPPNPAALFFAVDTDRSGAISAKELSAALTAGGLHAFELHTCKLLIAMFDADRSGTINQVEFAGVELLTSFESADRDRSGSVNKAECMNILLAQGYRLAPQVLDTLFAVYDEDSTGNIAFDEYIEMNCELQILTQVFKGMDTTRTGRVTVDFDGYIGLAYMLARMRK